MITEIGLAAGEIWQVLDKYNEISFTKLSKTVNRDKPMLLMSLGWLAREGHIKLVQDGDDYRITLVRKEGVEK